LPAIFYNDVSLNYAFKAAGHTARMFLAVDNLLNQAPRIWPGTNSSAAPGSSVPTTAGDDLVGRYFTAGVRMKY
jgi:hypothetical protein